MITQSTTSSIGTISKSQNGLLPTPLCKKGNKGLQTAYLSPFVSLLQFLHWCFMCGFMSFSSSKNGNPQKWQSTSSMQKPRFWAKQNNLAHLTNPPPASTRARDFGNAKNCLVDSAFWSYVCRKYFRYPRCTHTFLPTQSIYGFIWVKNV